MVDMETAHPDPDTLALAAVTGADEAPHVAECPSCRAEIAELRRIVADLRALPDPPASLVEAAKSYYFRRRRLEDLIERLAADPALRARARAKPEAVLRDAGLDPIPELVEALRSAEADRGTARSALEQRLAAKRLWL